MNTDLSTVDFGPFIGLIVGAIIIVIVVDRIGKSHGVGSGVNLESIIQIGAERSAAKRRRESESLQRALLHRIKILGIVAALCFALALGSLFYVLGALFEFYESDQGGINLALSGLIVGAVLTVVYFLQFANNKRTYEMYYGSIFEKKR